MTGTDDRLAKSARDAGLLATWRDNEGEERTVAPETLRSLLEALSSSAGGPGDGSDSDDDLGPLLIGTADGALRLPSALRRKRTGWRLIPDPENTWREQDGEDRRQASEGQLRGDGNERAIPLPAVPGYYVLEVGERRIGVAVTPQRCPALPAPMHRANGAQRRWGLAAQLYGLRREGDAGIGDFTALGLLAERAAHAGADALAISPTHALFAARPRHYSPYSPSSRLARNALYVDPWAEFGATQPPSRSATSMAASAAADGLIDWPAVAGERHAALDALFESMPDRHPRQHREFLAWCEQCPSSLRDHALFEALHGDPHLAGTDAAGWRTWSADHRDCDSAAVRAYARTQEASVQRHLFRQWLAARGLVQAQQRAHAAGMRIGLIADLAVGTDPDGSHVWSRRDDFLVGPTIGAPPDALGPDGQNWGLAAFSPHALRATGYRAFIELLRANLVRGGGLRIDHVMGLMRLWMIPAGGGAEDGAYLQYPLDELLGLLALEAFRHDCILIGEDLGTVPDGFRARLSDRGVHGMGVLLFEREGDTFLPLSKWRRDAVAYTTTHDLPTLSGWWTGADVRLRRELGLIDAQRETEALAVRRRERAALSAAIGADGGASVPGLDEAADVFVDAAIDHAGRSPAPLTILPLEDVTGTREQPNLPGTVDEHPNWRRRMHLPVERLFDDADVQRRTRLHVDARGAAEASL